MSVTLALTCPSFLKALTSSKCIPAGCRFFRLFMSLVSCRLLTWSYLAVVRERDNISTILFTACLPSLGRRFFPLALRFKRHTSDHTPAHAHTRTSTRARITTAILDAKAHTNDSASIFRDGKSSHGPSAVVD
ncbi:hypothetical protein EYF80_013601 [Liparis tanakae]|uniref:Uncharacterized protein n=1 Tax=Liparis tanakae TaxID=230148 RepID=A0A4Z2IDN3_9TELE|nr:hypothetical protein EYF80_013601 [Liparis tanakae]